MYRSSCFASGCWLNSGVEDFDIYGDLGGVSGSGFRLSGSLLAMSKCSGSAKKTLAFEEGHN